VEILKAQGSYRAHGNFEYVGFVPVYDGDFFPEPLETLQKKAPPKPVITGTTTDETGCFVTSVLPMDFELALKDPDSFTIQDLAQKLKHFLPEKQYQEWTPLVHLLALNHYVDSLGDRTNNTFVVNQYKQIFSDFLFVYPAYREALERHRAGSKVWLYSFDYYDHALFPKDYKYKGAYHYFELPFLFKMETMQHPSPFEGDDKTIKDTMTTLWTNFAIHGHPNPEQSPLHKSFSWDPITDQHPSRYLHISLETQQRDLYNQRMVSFWHRLLPEVLSLVWDTKAGGRPLKTEL
jgi:carboxylesterase type B